MKITFDLTNHPAARITLERYCGLVMPASGRSGWESRRELCTAWKLGTVTAKDLVEFARTGLRKHPTASGMVMAREIFSIGVAAWATESTGAKVYQYLLLHHLESRKGGTLTPLQIIGDYTYSPYGGTALGIDTPFRKRGLGHVFLLAAQKLAGKPSAAQILTLAGYANRKRAHRLAVSAQLKAGGAVPALVLMEYPALARRYA